MLYRDILNIISLRSITIIILSHVQRINREILIIIINKHT